jgi:(R,R)-butanediol dehydrogenase / meso-butanediol dehydrogenase / diacetyl reductase
MRAVRLHGIGDIRVEEVPAPPAPGAGELRLRVLAAGICGSDLHNFKTGQWIARLPITPGHEFAAEVLEVGAGVTGFKRGDHVVADSRASCGRCFQCQASRPNLCLSLGYVGEVCDGGFAEQVVLPASGLLAVDATVTPEVAALAEPLAVALHAVRRLGTPTSEPILVAGAGPVGGLVCLALDHFGCAPVLFAERQIKRRQLVAEVTRAAPVELDAQGLAAALGDRPLRFAVEATGSAAVLDRLLGIVAGGARIAMVGIFHGKSEINTNAIVEREIELKGCSVFADEQAEAVRLLPTLAPRLAQFVSAPIGLDAVPAAYRDLIEGRAPALKTIIRP